MQPPVGDRTDTDRSEVSTVTTGKRSVWASDSDSCYPYSSEQSCDANGKHGAEGRPRGAVTWEAWGSHTGIQIRGCESLAWRLKPNSRAVRSLHLLCDPWLLSRTVTVSRILHLSLEEIKHTESLPGNASACC